MNRNIRIIVANPAGNITIFVLDNFERSEYTAVASQLLNMEDLKGEQVAFIKSIDEMEMCGLEFCGNASRSFGLIKGKNLNILGEGQVDVKVSGSNEILSVQINTDTNYTKIEMPKPIAVTNLSDCQLKLLENSTLVDMDGIFHIIVRDLTPSEKNFNLIKDYIYSKLNPPAFGVMFYDTTSSFLTPVVYVKDVETTYFEGSCGSGTTATAVAFSQSESDGIYHYTLAQPAGAITATVEKVRGQISSVYIEGPVQLSDIIYKEIDL